MRVLRSIVLPLTVLMVLLDPEQQRPTIASRVRIGFGLAGVAPVDHGIGEQLDVADRNTGPKMTGGTGFQQQHLVACIRRKPVQDDRAGKSGAYTI